MSDAESASVLRAVLRDLQARREQAASGGGGRLPLVTDAHAQLLAALPPSQLALLQSASELVHRRAGGDDASAWRLVKRVTAQPSGRRFFRVESLSRYQREREEGDPLAASALSQPFDAAAAGGGARAHYYNVLPHYCSCQGFHERTAQSPTAMCKHMLAALLAEATDQLQHVAIRDADFATMLCAQPESASAHHAAYRIAD